VPTLTHPVPSDVEPTTLGDLIADCRAMVSGVFPVRRVIDLTRSTPLPVQRVPGARQARRVAIDIREHVVKLVEGVSDYGSC
jgi:hypothetical protein